MTLSRAEIELVLEEIEPLTGRCVIQRVLEADRRTRVLQLRQPGQTHHLLLSTKPQATRVHFVGERPDQPARPSAFTMQLRKWLGGALLERVEQVSRDRIVRLSLASVDPSWEPAAAADDDRERAPRVAISLVVELTGRHPNWFLLDADDTIIGQLDAEVIGGRDLKLGVLYQPPPPPPDPSVGSRVRWELERLDPVDKERSGRIAGHYGRRLHERQLEQTHTDIQERLARRVERLERRIEHVEGDLARAENAQEYKRRGELLQSAWGKVERGDSSVRVPDFYDEDMPEVEIPLDPALDLQENIEQNFHEYHRLEQARDKIEQRLLESIEQRDAARAALDALADQPEDLQALEEFAERLQAQGVLAPKRKKKRYGRDDTKRLPYREFESKHGSAILVGRGAADNDTLSTSVARGRDMWFHARDWAGAHVVLRMRKDDSPKNEDLIDAATLAAWFSRGKEDTVVDVTYTRAKYVRKPKGFPPGRVTVADASTIGVAIEEARVKRLLDSE